MLNIENKFSKIKGIYNTEKKMLEDEIKEAENKKTRIFIEMGILLYDKIRDQIIEDPTFEKMSEELVGLDKLIYDNSIKIQGNKIKKTELNCECGNLIEKDNKFCSKCGKMIGQEEDINTIECLSCGSEIDIDSKYCVCCGSKLNNQIYIDEK